MPLISHVRQYQRVTNYTWTVILGSLISSIRGYEMIMFASDGGVIVRRF